MARIATYSQDTSISADDLLIGTDAEDSNITKNYKVGDLRSFMTDSGITHEKIIISTDELRNLHTTPKILVDVTAGNPKEICQVYSVIFTVGGNSASNNLVFPNDINIEAENASPWKYIIPQAIANSQGIPFYVPSFTAGYSNLDSDVVLSSAGAAVETGTATTTMTVWITYRIFEINA